MKRILFLLAVSVTFVFAGTAAVSAERGTPLRDQPPQGQPPQGQPPQGQQMQGRSGPGNSTSGQPGQGQQGPVGQPGQGDWSGVVKTVSSSSLTVTRAGGDTFTAVISSATKIELLVTQTTGTVDNIAAGNNVTIQGRKNADGSVAAARILVEPAGSKVAGSVTAISSATLTVSTQKDKVSVVTSSDTKFYKGKDAISLSDVTKGVFVTAYGTKASDGSLTATYVIVADNHAPGQEAAGQAQAVRASGRAAASEQDSSIQLDAGTLDKLVQWLKSYLNMQ